jgi:hypothetical protein
MIPTNSIFLKQLRWQTVNLVLVIKPRVSSDLSLKSIKSDQVTKNMKHNINWITISF